MLADTTLSNPLVKALKLFEGFTDIPVVAEMPPGERKYPIVIIEVPHLTDATPVTTRLQVAVWVWDTSSTHAYEIAEKLHVGLKNTKNTKGVTRVRRVDGPIYMPCPDTGVPRYFAQYLIDFRQTKCKKKNT